MGVELTGVRRPLAARLAALRTLSSVQRPPIRRLTAVVTREDSWHVARCLDVEVTSQGRTIESALDNLREALRLYFEGEAASAG
jgi:predicted RNase H-like HicB family nuclease